MATKIKQLSASNSKGRTNDIDCLSNELNAVLFSFSRWTWFTKGILNMKFLKN